MHIVAYLHIYANCSKFLYFFHNMLFSNKVTNCKNRKCLIYESTTKYSCSMAVCIETVLIMLLTCFHLTIDQQYLAIVRLKTGCFQRDVATKLSVAEHHQQVTTETQ